MAAAPRECTFEDFAAEDYYERIYTGVCSVAPGQVALSRVSFLLALGLIYALVWKRDAIVDRYDKLPKKAQNALLYVGFAICALFFGFLFKHWAITMVFEPLGAILNREQWQVASCTFSGQVYLGQVTSRRPAAGRFDFRIDQPVTVTAGTGFHRQQWEDAVAHRYPHWELADEDPYELLVWWKSIGGTGSGPASRPDGTQFKGFDAAQQLDEMRHQGTFPTFTTPVGHQVKCWYLPPAGESRGTREAAHPRVRLSMKVAAGYAWFLWLAAVLGVGWLLFFSAMFVYSICSIVLELVRVEPTYFRFPGFEERQRVRDQAIMRKKAETKKGKLDKLDHLMENGSWGTIRFDPLRTRSDKPY